MSKARAFLFLLLSGGVIGVLTLLVLEKPQPPFAHSLSPLFLELGKPLKSLDRAVSGVLPISDIDECLLGDEIKARFAESSKPTTEEAEASVRYLDALAESLSLETRRSIEYQVFLVEGPPNAFAMPGGALCVTSGLLDILENEAELVAVLAHEIGHVERGHLFDAVRGEMLRRKIAEVTLLTYATDAIQTVFSISFSKAQENEADEYGFRMLLKKGYDPIAMSSAFEKLIRGSSDGMRASSLVEDFFNTHPETEHRIEKFRSRAQLWKQKHPSEDLVLGRRNLHERITIFE